MASTLFVKIPQRAAERALNPCTVWRHIRDGIEPPPVKVSANSTRLIRAELDAVDRARVAGADDAAIRELIKSLVAARKTAAA